MVFKTVLSPDDLSKLVPHWPELEDEKLPPLEKARRRFAKERHPYRGIHVEGIVLDVPPIIVTRSTVNPKDTFLLDGKHRAYRGIITGSALVAFHIERAQDIQHGLPRKLLEKIEAGMRTTFEEYFQLRDQYERMTRQDGVNSMADLIALRLKNASQKEQ